MTRRLPPLTSMRAFEAAGRHLSFTRAADELNVTQGAVSRQIRALEDYLGVRLFRRVGRAVVLTTQGDDYLRAVREGLDGVERATLRLLGRPEAQVLTLNVLPTLASRWVIPRLLSFTEPNAPIEVRMITSIAPVDFGREDIDVAIRVGTPAGQHPEPGAARIALVMTEQWQGVRADFLFPDVLVPVGGRRLLAEGPPLRRPEDLASHVLLHTATRPHAWPDWLSAVGLSGLTPRGELSYGHFFMTLQAAAEGRGLAIVPTVLVAGDLTATNLVVPFDVPVRSEGGYYLLYREHHRDVPKVRLFRDWVLSQAAEVRESRR